MFFHSKTALASLALALTCVGLLSASRYISEPVALGTKTSRLLPHLIISSPPSRETFHKVSRGLATSLPSVSQVGQITQEDSPRSQLRKHPKLISAMDHIGITICASPGFSHVAGGRLFITDKRCLEESRGSTYQECAMRRQYSREIPLTARTYHGEGIPIPSFRCVVVRCPKLCHEALSQKEQCALWGGINVHLIHRSPPKITFPASVLHSRSPNVLLFLVDSVSWKAWVDDFQLSQKSLFGLSQRHGMEFIPFRNTNALGAQSAINHAALYSGRVPEKCAYFKTRREGIPTKKDGGPFFTAFEKIKKDYLVRDPVETFHHHFLKEYHKNGYRTGMVLPLSNAAWETHCLDYEDEDSSMTADFVTDMYWRFYNAAVNMDNRDQGTHKVQGCIGQDHVMEYIHNISINFFDSTWDKPGILFVAEQTPHQITSAHIPNFDERLAKYFEALEKIPGFYENTVIILAADHGKGIHTNTRSDVLRDFQNIMHPFFYLGIPISVKKNYPDWLKNALQNRDDAMSPFDTYETLLDIAHRDIQSEDPKRRGLSLIRPRKASDRNRSCTELGVLPFACRHFVEHPLVAPYGDTYKDLFKYALQYVNVQIRNGGMGAECHFLSEKEGQITSAFRRVIAGAEYVSMLVEVRVVPTAEIVTFRVESKPFQYSTDWKKKRDSRLRLFNVVRISAYKNDERDCGWTVYKHVEMQYCVCRKRGAASPQKSTEGWVGG